MRSLLFPVAAVLTACVPSLDQRCDTTADCESGLVCDDSYCVSPTGRMGLTPDGGDAPDARTDGPDASTRDASPDALVADDGGAPDRDARPEGDIGGAAVCGDGTLEGDEACDHADDPHCTDCEVLEPQVEAGDHDGFVQAGSFDRWRLSVAEGPVVLRAAARAEGGCLPLTVFGEDDPRVANGCPSEWVVPAGEYVVEIRPEATAAYTLELWLGAVCGNGGVEVGEACDDGNDDRGDGCDRCRDSSACAPWHLADDAERCEPPEPVEDCPPGTHALPGGCSEARACPEGWLANAAGACRPPEIDACDGRPALATGCLPPWECGDWNRLQPYGCAPPPLRCEDGERTAVARCVARLPACEHRHLPEDDLVYVDVENPGGTGTLDDPAPSLEDVLTDMMLDVRDPGPIALLPGTHRVPLGIVPPGVSITGLCAESTRVVGSLVVPRNAEVRLRGIELAPGAGGAAPLQVSGEARVTLERVHLSGASRLSVFGTAVGDQLVVDVAPLVDGGTFECDGCAVAGVESNAGATVELTDSTVEGAVLMRETALSMSAVRVVGEVALVGGDARLSGVAVVDAVAGQPGIAVGEGATLTVSQVYVGAASGAAVHLADGAVLRGDALTAREVADGVVMAGDCEVDLSRLAVNVAGSAGIAVGRGEGAVSFSQVHLTDLRGATAINVRGRAVSLTDVAVGQRAGAAVRAGDGAEVEVRNLRASGPGTGILAAAAALDLEAVRLDELGGFGVLVGEGGSLQASRLVVDGAADGNEGPAVLVAGPVGPVAIRDSGVFGHLGAAVAVVGEGDAEVTLDGVWVDGEERGDGVTALVVPGSEAAVSLTVEGLDVREVVGRGLGADGAVVRGSNVTVRDVRGTGLEVRGGADVALEQVLLADGGLGASVTDATLRLERSRVARNGSYGVSASGELTLQDVTVRGNTDAGAWLWGGTANLRRVRFAENGVGLLYDGSAVALEPDPLVHHEGQVVDEEDCAVERGCP